MPDPTRTEAVACRRELTERTFGANDGLFSTLHASVFCSVAGYALVIPWMKDLLRADQLGAARYGQLQSLGNLSGLLSSAPVGRVADRMGRRVGMVLCSCLATLGAICLWMGATGGVPTWLPVVGLMLRRSERASFTAVATAVTADASSSDADRSRRIGQLNMVFCLGFTFGSSATGKIGDIAESWAMAPEGLVAPAAVFVGLLTLFVVGVLLPIPVPCGSATAPSSSSLSTPTSDAIRPMVWDRRIIGLLIVRILVGGAFFLVTGTFDLYCRDRFSFQGGDYGRFLAFAGCSWAAVNGIVVPALFDRFIGEQDVAAAAAMEQKLLVCSLFSLGLSRLAYSYCDLLGLAGLFIVEIWCVQLGSDSLSFLIGDACPDLPRCRWIACLDA